MVSRLAACCIFALIPDIDVIDNPSQVSTHFAFGPSWGSQNVINGSLGHQGEFKYILALAANRYFICGAVLIEESVALTAAHCVQNTTYVYSVLAGDLDLLSRSGYEVVRTVTTIIRHPSYNNASGWPNDIAILKFDPIVPTQFIQPIPWVKHQQFLSGKACLISGWGKENGTDKSASRYLRYAKIHVLTVEQCRKTYPNIGRANVCVLKKKYHKTPCSGDSGGPLVCKIGGRTQLVGLTSWGEINCTGDYPGVYTRVSYHSDWISKYIQP